MPLYSFYCERHHESQRYASIHKIPKWMKCERCGKRSKLGIAGGRVTGAIRNQMLDRKQRELYRFVFGKKKAARMRTTADVEANLEDFTRRYPHLAPGYVRGKSYDLNSKADMKSLGIPGERLSDPFPETEIREDPKNNMKNDSRR